MALEELSEAFRTTQNNPNAQYITDAIVRQYMPFPSTRSQFISVFGEPWPDIHTLVIMWARMRFPLVVRGSEGDQPMAMEQIRTWLEKRGQ